jgi:beta-lactamase class A
VSTTLSANALNALAGRHGLASPSIVVRALGADPWTAELDAGAQLSPASMIKVPLAAATIALARAGVLGLGDPVAVTAANLTANDAASPLEPGYTASVAELIDLAVSRSDNVATNMLIDVAGRERASAVLHALGLAATHIRRKLSGADPLIDDPGASGRNAHPAADAARLFELIARDAVPGAGRLLRALNAQVWNDKLPRWWPQTDRFAHKTGDTSEVSHDGGILFAPDGARYVVVVYTGLPSGPAADERIAAFGRELRALL